MIWIIPCCGVLLFLSIRMVKKHLALVLNGVNDRIKTLAKGDLTGKVTHNDNRELDEIGKINNSINLLITNQSNVIKNYYGKLKIQKESMKR